MVIIRISLLNPLAFSTNFLASSSLYSRLSSSSSCLLSLLIHLDRATCLTLKSLSYHKSVESEHVCRYPLEVGVSREALELFSIDESYDLYVIFDP